MQSSSLNSSGSDIWRSFRIIEVHMTPAVTPNDSIWVVWSLHTADWHDLAFFMSACSSCLTKLPQHLLAEELCRRVKLTIHLTFSSVEHSLRQSLQVLHTWIFSWVPSGGWGLLPYIGSIGMCRRKWYDFWGSRFLNRVSFFTLFCCVSGVVLRQGS